MGFKFSFPLRGLLICMLGPRMVFPLSAISQKHWDLSAGSKLKGTRVLVSSAESSFISVYARVECSPFLTSLGNFSFEGQLQKSPPRTPFGPEKCSGFLKNTEASSPWGLLMNKGEISVGLKDF